MKTKEQLDKDAQEYFALYPKADKLFATTDGLFFSQEEEGAAKARAEKKQITFFEFNRVKDEPVKAKKTTRRKKKTEETSLSPSKDEDKNPLETDSKK